MTQLLLNLQATPPPLLDNYVAGGNGELLSRLRGLADRGSFDALYLWGGDGCGKSHLLAGAIAEAAKQRPTRLLAAHDITNDFAPPPGALLAVDDVHQLDAAAQIDLFRVFNAARLAGLALLLAGNQPPARLMLREDLRTRIGQMLVLRNQAAQRRAKVSRADTPCPVAWHAGRRQPGALSAHPRPP